MTEQISLDDNSCPPRAVTTSDAGVGTADSDTLRETVRARYAEAADSVGAGAKCCDARAEVDRFGSTLYGAEVEVLPDQAVAASLGCGNPTAVADLFPGETVLDLGSGGGIDVLLSARRVGPTGKAIGLDMTDEMLDLARRNQREAGADNVEFLQGYIEDVPLPESAVDVVISNCVINLSANKPKVFAEMFRVLRPGGRIGISDVVADDRLTPEDRIERGSYTGCIAGALTFSEYRDGLADVGFEAVDVEPTHQVADGMHGAIIKAHKPEEAKGADAA